MFNRYQVGPGGPLAPPSLIPSTTPKLTYEDLQERREELLQKRQEDRQRARKWGSSITELGDGLDAVVANADNLGDSFRYAIEQKVNLSRQMSALVPVFNSGIQSSSFSIFNKQVHPRFPLKALRLKNTTGQSIVQGPVSVFEEGAYAGDTQVPDMQPDQERLISYAMDLGVEVRDHRDSSFDVPTRMSLNRGTLTITRAQRVATTYTLRNRSSQDRTVLVEHPIDPEWTYSGADKPIEKTGSLYRFEWKVPAGKKLVKDVPEEREQFETRHLIDMPDPALKSLLTGNEAYRPVEDLVRAVLEKRRKMVATQADLTELNETRQANEKEQDRLRVNVDTVPKDSAVQKRYLASLEQLESAHEKLREQIREKQESHKKQRLELEDFYKSASAETGKLREGEK